MTRPAHCIVGLAIAAFGCATATETPDHWTSDPVAEDTYDTPWDSPVDVPWETSDPFTEPDALDATDGTDAGDPVEEDAGVDPGTCTVADFVTQAMCATGYKCTFGEVDTSGNAIPICDVVGTAGYNGTCTTVSDSDDCQRGYLCVGSSTDARCKPFCSSDTQCRTTPGGANSLCVIELVVGSGTTTIPGVTLCSIHCDPLNTYSSGCATGQACRSTALTTGEWFTDCREAGTGTGCIAGTEDDCPAGQGCFNTGGSTNECLRYCSTSTGSPCTGLETCTAVTDWPTWIGACL